MPARPARFVPLGLIAGASAVALGLSLIPGAATTADSAAASVADPVPDPFTAAANGLTDVDERGTVRPPTTAQRDAARLLDASLRWNRYGTPASILPADGLLGPATGGPVATARQWLADNAALFGMSVDQLNALELVNDQRMARGDGHALLFRQRFGDLVAAVDGMVTVGVDSDGVAYVSSSLAPTGQTPEEPALDAAEAWRIAADDVGLDVAADALESVTGVAAGDWSRFAVDGIAQQQQVRLRALALADGSVRPVYETNVVDVSGDGGALAYTSYVDAIDGTVLVRHNQVDYLLDVSAAPAVAPQAEPYTGAMTAGACGPAHDFDVAKGQQSIVVTATAGVATNDIVLKLMRDGEIVASADTGTSPEAITYSPGGGIPAGTWTVRVCPFDDPTVPFVAPGDYTGTFLATDVAAQAPAIPRPAWKAFLSNPRLDFSPDRGGGRRATMCWTNQPDLGCTRPPGPVNNAAARYPWDVDPRVDKALMTTEGNAAITAEAWTSPLTPGAIGQRPLQPDRTYDDPFRDTWNNQRCNPTALLPGGNDINAAVTNLFVQHNRMHDYSWWLGFTEDNYNLQQSNFGQGGLDLDPEIGNAQAGAIDGGAPTYLGRDNANQITLQDGVPGITNQYLFQPLAGAFYSPCVDGDLDMSVIGHEYTHAISNRMVGGPDQGLTGLQAGSMGESWSDQVALEYLFSHGYSTGANTWVEGPYVTGNKRVGIRNYALHRNPLQYGDVGYDLTGAEVHADGEVWSAAMFDVRKALVRKYDQRYPYTDKRLQLRCSEGRRGSTSPLAPLPPVKCPGNIRWVALMFDSFLLQQPATSMLDARDAFLAADRMRFHGKNRKAIWDAFARNGMGKGAISTSTDDAQPRPSYASPTAREGRLTVRAIAVDKAGRPTVRGTLYASRYEARITPVADTMPKTKRDNRLAMVPGRYTFTFRAPGYGITRFQQAVRAGATPTRVLRLRTNLASSTSGARIDGAATDSINAAGLIDDTQATNWGASTSGTSVDASRPVINVDLSGGLRSIKRVKVSAMLRPATDADPDAGSRFTALRKFAIEVCRQTASRDCSTTGKGPAYRRIFVSSDRAFPTTRPRPLAPNLLLRSFNIPDVKATHVRLVVLENQCSGTRAYAGEQDADPLNATDCKSASDRDEIVHAAELQVFG